MLILNAFRVPTQQPNAPTTWLPGRKVMIAADMAVISTEGHPNFRIMLALDTTTVQSLVQRALSLVPGQPPPPRAPRATMLPPPPVRQQYQ